MSASPPSPATGVLHTQAAGLSSLSGPAGRRSADIALRRAGGGTQGPSGPSAMAMLQSGRAPSGLIQSEEHPRRTCPGAPAPGPAAARPAQALLPAESRRQLPPLPRPYSRWRVRRHSEAEDGGLDCFALGPTPLGHVGISLPQNYYFLGRHGAGGYFLLRPQAAAGARRVCRRDARGEARRGGGDDDTRPLCRSLPRRDLPLPLLGDVVCRALPRRAMAAP